MIDNIKKERGEITSDLGGLRMRNNNNTQMFAKPLAPAAAPPPLVKLK
jgi:hypothetical protein